MKSTLKIIVIATILFILNSCGTTEEKETDDTIISEETEITDFIKRDNYSPSVGDDNPRNVYWGDTHLHTKYSPDANLTGNEALGPADAFRFASGKEVTANNGMTAKLVRPLDFLVVTDHAEYMGLLPGIADGNKLLLSTEYGKELAKKLKAENGIIWSA